MNYLDIENKGILLSNIFRNEPGKRLQDTNPIYAYC